MDPRTASHYNQPATRRMSDREIREAMKDKVDALLKEEGDAMIDQRMDRILRSKIDRHLNERIKTAMNSRSNYLVNEQMVGMERKLDAMIAHKIDEVLEIRKEQLAAKLEQAIGNRMENMMHDRLNRMTPSMDKILRKRVGRPLEAEIEKALDARLEVLIEEKLNPMMERKVSSKLDDKIDRFVDLKVSRYSSNAADEELKADVNKHIEERVECIVVHYIDALVLERVVEVLDKRGEKELADRVQTCLDELRKQQKNKMYAHNHQRTTSIHPRKAYSANRSLAAKESKYSIVNDKMESPGSGKTRSSFWRSRSDLGKKSQFGTPTDVSRTSSRKTLDRSSSSRDSISEQLGDVRDMRSRWRSNTSVLSDRGAELSLKTQSAVDMRGRMEAQRLQATGSSTQHDADLEPSRSKGRQRAEATTDSFDVGVQEYVAEGQLRLDKRSINEKFPDSEIYDGSSQRNSHCHRFIQIHEAS